MTRIAGYLRYVDRFEGKRLNSPNDLVYKSDGSLYFTDPPYGLIEQDEGSRKGVVFQWSLSVFEWQASGSRPRSDETQWDRLFAR